MGSMLAQTAQTGQSNLQINTVEDMQKLSLVLAESGFFEDAKSAAQCFVKILAGKELGFPAFSSMTGIHIIKGKPAVGASLMAAKIKGSGKYDYKIKALNSDICEIEFYQGKDLMGVSTFSKQDAAAAGTQNMSKYARNMLFARAMSNGVRFYCPDIFLGSPVYTPEELGAEVNEEGSVVDVSALVPEPKSTRNWTPIKEWTAIPPDQIKSIAAGLNFPAKPSELTIEQSDTLMLHVLAQWALNQYPAVFNAFPHALNAINKLAQKLGAFSDAGLWSEWSFECSERALKKAEPAPGLD